MQASTLNIDNRLSELERAFAWVDHSLAAMQADDRLRNDIKVVLDEVFANIVRHGGDGSTTLQLHASTQAMVLDIRDNTAPFNPLDVPPPNLDGSHLDRPAGGLGLVLVRQLSDEQSYCRDGDRNHLRLVWYRRASS